MKSYGAIYIRIRELRDVMSRSNGVRKWKIRAQVAELEWVLGDA